MIGLVQKNNTQLI